MLPITLVLILSVAYYSQNYASIICQGLVATQMGEIAASMGAQFQGRI